MTPYSCLRQDASSPRRGWKLLPYGGGLLKLSIFSESFGFGFHFLVFHVFSLFYQFLYTSNTFNTSSP